MNLEVEIDRNSGFCFGVIRAIEKAETELREREIYSLGDIVHNEQEMQRLRALGLRAIQHEELNKIKHCRILFRAHGEPPQTYKLALSNNNQIVDATCPVVLNLQKLIRMTYKEISDNGIEAQIVILGKIGHAEVVGLQGQTANTAIVIQTENDVDKIDYSKRIYLFSQTTASPILFENIVNAIKKRVGDESNFKWTNTLCKNVSQRVKFLHDFVVNKDIIFFVGGSNSSNAKYLFEQCKTGNADSYFFSEIDKGGIKDILSKYTSGGLGRSVKIGICGATSTPQWLLEKMREVIIKIGLTN